LNPRMHDAIKDFISGGVGGIALVLVGQPFDNMKVQLQASGSLVTQKKTLFSVVRDIYQSPLGVRNFYRGVYPVLFGVAPTFAVCFLTYAQAKTFFRSVIGVQSDEELPLFYIAMSGLFTAFPTTLLLTPGERIKIVMQTNSSSGSSIEVFKKIIQTGGIKSLYKGALLTLLRDGSGSFAYFSVYEATKRSMSSTSSGPNISTAAILLAGGLAGCANWLIALPFDVLKTRTQQSDISTTSTLALARTLIQTYGIKGLYRGLLPALLRAFPANAACFYGMELSRKMLN